MFFLRLIAWYLQNDESLSAFSCIDFQTCNLLDMQEILRLVCSLKPSQDFAYREQKGRCSKSKIVQGNSLKYMKYIFLPYKDETSKI
jgi:hypothetical protein